VISKFLITGGVSEFMRRLPHLKIIIPGHGNYGNTELLDYTIDLFKPKNE